MQLNCKIISGSDMQKVESEVNDFLKVRSRIIIHSVHQSAGGGKIYVTIFFHQRSRSARAKEVMTEEIHVELEKNLPVKN